MNKRMTIGIVAALLLTASLSSGGSSMASSGSNGIEGAWQVTIHRDNPPPGQPTEIEALINYAADGTLTESSNSGILRRTVGYGEWVRIGPRLYASSHVSFQFNPTTVVAAVLFSLVVGVVFGVWPARQAARLDPITALRYE